MNQMLDVLSVKTYTDKEGKEQNSFIRCGIAFPHKKSETGYNLKLDVHNTTGEYLLLPKKDWKEQS